VLLMCLLNNNVAFLHIRYPPKVSGIT
jgi:hypothetical protein